MVGERGTTLSGGQRQRITLARALAGAPRLLVLDDATSAVDPRVEAAILSGLRRSGCSILVVAYRRATIALADEVVYLERGRVVARGRTRCCSTPSPGTRTWSRRTRSGTSENAAEQDHDLAEVRDGAPDDVELDPTGVRV